MPEPRFDVTTFGEAMLRLSVPAGERLQDADTLQVHVGGAESNVASALARLGRNCAWLGRLPDSALGHTAANQLRQAGVNLDGVVWNAHARMGLYFVEFARAASTDSGDVRPRAFRRRAIGARANKLRAAA